MDFIRGLSRSYRKHDSIMVVVYRLPKIAHFILVKSTHPSSEVEHVFIRDITRLHGISRDIVSDKNSELTSRF